MKEPTRHYYRKRIKELVEQNNRMADDLYQFRTACSEIHDGVISVMKDGKVLASSWILERLKRAWRR